MIKKLLTMSAGIVLGSMITTASFAGSDDCHYARAVYACVLGAVQDCKGGNCVDTLSNLRDCKRACAKVYKEICVFGSYPDPLPNPDGEIPYLFCGACAAAIDCDPVPDYQYPHPHWHD